ncbi:MAG TPA: BTAD domain-containing putative transcriptional regulator [Acidimicrobiales bacterium]
MRHDGVEVAVLGPVSVRGVPQPFRRAAARELVVYLAFHREGVRHGEWALALWPDRPVSPATVHSTASDALRALGETADGAARLPCGPRLRLDRSVGTDVDRFGALVRSGRYIEAVRLVRGPLFGGLRRSDWAVLDGTLAEVEASVVQAVLRGADALLRSGRAAESEWTVRRGLAASPYDERLYRALLRALSAQGNRVGLRAAMAQLLVLAGDPPAPPMLAGWAGGAWEPLHPETTALYRELLCGRPATGGAPARL